MRAHDRRVLFVYEYYDDDDDVGVEELINFTVSCCFSSRGLTSFLPPHHTSCHEIHISVYLYIIIFSSTLIRPTVYSELKTAFKYWHKWSGIFTMCGQNFVSSHNLYTTIRIGFLTVKVGSTREDQERIPLLCLKSPFEWQWAGIKQKRETSRIQPTQIQRHRNVQGERMKIKRFSCTNPSCGYLGVSVFLNSQIASFVEGLPHYFRWQAIEGCTYPCERNFGPFQFRCLHIQEQPIMYIQADTTLSIFLLPVAPSRWNYV